MSARVRVRGVRVRVRVRACRARARAFVRACAYPHAARPPPAHPSGHRDPAGLRVDQYMRHTK